jgi:predicted nucleic acid-binding protein
VKRFVVDTGLLLIHAASIFENGRLLAKTVSFLKIPEPDIEALAKMIDRLFSSVGEIWVTPYVLAEFCNLAQSRLDLRDNRLEEFLNLYNNFLLKMKEWHCRKEELIAFKESMKFCFTDSSLALVSKREGIPLFTIDKKLVEWCKSKGIEAKHVYYDFYFESCMNI